MTITWSAKSLHHRQVVGDEDEGDAELALELVEQRDHLRLDRDVERGDRLVGDDQLGLERQRPGDGDALALAAGELVRVALGVLGREADLARSSATRSRHFAFGRMSGWITQASEMIWKIDIRGFKRLGRVLEHHLDVAAHGIEIARGHGEEVAALPERLPESASISRTIALATVDLPDPDSPTTASTSPFCSSKDTSSSLQGAVGLARALDLQDRLGALDRSFISPWPGAAAISFLV